MSKPLFEPSWDWDLPARPYLPGRSPRPQDDDDVHRVARQAPQPTEPDGWRANRAWLAGFRLYAGGFFWEAHEVWEPVWMGARPNSPERALVQGVIQITNAALKLRLDRPAAARRLAAMAHGHVRDAQLGGYAVLMGLDLARLDAELDVFARDLAGKTARPPSLSLVDA